MASTSLSFEALSLLATANHYREVGEYNEAIAIYQQAIELQADAANIYDLLGQTLAQKGEFSKAIILYRQALELGIETPFWTYKHLGDALREQENFDEAIAAYNRAIKLQEKNPDVYYSLGQTYAKLTKFSQAIHNYQKAIDLGLQKPVWTYKNLGDAFRQQENFDEAIEAYQKSILLEPNKYIFYVNLGQIYVQQGKLKPAIVLYQKSIQLNPQQPAWIYKELARLVEKVGEFNPENLPELEFLENSIELAQSPQKLESNIEANTANTTEPEQAIAESEPETVEPPANVSQPDTKPTTKSEITTTNNTWQEFQQLADTFREAGNIEEAIAAYQHVVHLNPNLFECQYWLGDLLKQQENWQQSEIAYRQAANLLPNHGWTYFNLGFVLSQQGKLTEAETEYQTALEVGSDDSMLCDMTKSFQEKLKQRQKMAVLEAGELEETWEAWNKLGTSLREAGHFERAISVYRRATTLDPERSESHYGLGVIFQQKEWWDEAEQAYRQVIDLNPNHVLAHYNLGFTLVQQNKLDEAMGFYQTVLDSDEPELCKPAREAIEAITKLKTTASSDPWQSYCQLAEFFTKQHNIKEAVKAYYQAIECNPDGVESYFGLANLLVQEYRWQEAEFALERAIELQPERLEAYQALITSYIEQEKLEPLMNLYQRMFDLGVSATELHSHLNLILEQLEQKDKMAAVYQYLSQENLEVTWIHQELGKKLWQKACLYSSYAMHAYYQAIRLEPHNPDNYYQAIAIEPKNANLHVQLGNALVRQKQFSKAIVHYQMALEIQPTHVEASSQLNLAREKLKSKSIND